MGRSGRRLLTFVGVLCCVVSAALAPGTADALPVPLAAPWGPTNGEVDAVAIDSAANAAFLGGTFHGLGPVIGGFAAVSPTTGLLDRGVEPSGWTPIDLGVLVADGSGGVFGAGEVRLADGTLHQGLVHVRADGTLDRSFLPDVTGTVYALARSGATLFVGGQFTSIAGSSAHPNLAALSTTTGAPVAWAAGTPNGAVRALALGGTALAPALYAGGDFTHVGAAAHPHLAAFIPRTGALEPTFAGSTNGPVFALTAFGAVVYAGGTFTAAGALTRHYVAAFSIADGSPTAFDPEPDEAVLALATNGSTVYLGGAFDAVGTYARIGLAAVSASTSLPDSFRDDVRIAEGQGLVDALVLAEETLYVVGVFDQGGTAAAPVERHDAMAVDATTGAVQGWDASPNAGLGFDETLGLAVDSGHVFLGGRFTTVAAVHRNALAEVDLDSGEALAWNPDVDGEVEAVAVYGGRVYAGGRFTHVNGPFEERVDIASFEESSGLDESWNPHVTGSITSRVTSIIVDARGVLFGGVFQKVGGQNREAVAEVDRTSGALLPFNPEINKSHESVASGVQVARDDEGGALLAGEFGLAGGKGRPLVARFAADGTLQPLFLTPGPYGYVNTLLLDGKIAYLTGGTREINGVETNGFGAFDLTSGVLTGFEARVRSPTPYSVESLVELGGRLYAGGYFSGIGGTIARPDLAAVDPTSGDDSGWDAKLVDPGESTVRALAGSADVGLIAAGMLHGADGARADGVLHYAIEPAAPAAPSASAEVASATVTAAPPADGGSPVTRYTAIASPGGATASSASPTIVVGGLTPGTSYTFRVFATNAAGDSPSSPSSNVVVPTAPEEALAGGGTEGGGSGGNDGGANGGGSGGNDGGANGHEGPPDQGGTPNPPDDGDHTAPRLSAVRLTPGRFRLRGPKHGPGFAHPLFATLHLKLSEPARLALSVTAKLRHRHRAATVLRLPTKKLGSGVHALRFRGRPGRRQLGPGHYKLVLRATDATGNTSAPTSRAFTVNAR